MNRSEQIGELIAALAKAQGEFPAIKKDSKNYYGGKYAQLDSIVDAVRPALSKNEIAFYHDVSSDLESRTASVTTYLQRGEQWISTSAEASAVNFTWDKETREMRERFDTQTISIVWTYFKRTQLQAITGVAAEEDDDAQPLVGNNPPQQRRVTPAQVTPPPNAPPVTPTVEEGNFNLIGDLLECVIKGATPKTTKKNDPYLTVVWNGRIGSEKKGEGLNYGFCFHESLHAAIKSAIGKHCILRLKEKRATATPQFPYGSIECYYIEDVIHVDGVDYADGKPVEAINV